MAQPPSAVGQTFPASAAYQRNLPHIEKEGRSYFITFSTWNRWVLPGTARDIILSHCLHDHGTRLHLHGAVIMPDHVHLVLTPLLDTNGGIFRLAQIMSGLKGSAAHAINKALNRRGRVWQDESFDHVLRSDESAVSKVEYICQNPVRKGLVASVEEYRWIWREWIEGLKSQSQPGAAVPHGHDQGKVSLNSDGGSTPIHAGLLHTAPP